MLVTSPAASLFLQPQLQPDFFSVSGSGTTACSLGWAVARTRSVVLSPALPREDIARRLAFDAARPTELDDAPAPRAVAVLLDLALRVAVVLAKPALPPEDIAWRLAFDAARPTELDDAPAPRAVAERLGVELRVAVVVLKPALPPDDMAWRLAFDAARALPL